MTETEYATTARSVCKRVACLGHNQSRSTRVSGPLEADLFCSSAIKKNSREIPNISWFPFSYGHKYQSHKNRRRFENDKYKTLTKAVLIFLDILVDTIFTLCLKHPWIHLTVTAVLMHQEFF